MIFSFDAFVTNALFDRSGRAMFALGDGTVRLQTDEGFVTVEAHGGPLGGAVLAAAVHPSGAGIVTGGDDGRVVWSRIEGGEIVATLIAEVNNKWIEHVATSPASGLIAFTAGKDVHVRDAADRAFARNFPHEKTVSGLAFEPKGRRLASATYGGAYLWYARIADQKPTVLKWAGSHIAVEFSPDGKFLISSMQENQLHGWRLSDGKDMRMGGYPSKIKSVAFFDKGNLLATAGASGAVIWPFAGANGPMGKEAAEIGFSRDSMVVRVAGIDPQPVCIAGQDNGKIWAAHMRNGRIETLKAEKGASISALSVSADGRQMAWGDESGEAGVLEIPDLSGPRQFVG
ncbi:WD40 repeat domain-containing protein [Caulobacter sp. SL161]|uniref:WD40 repeat domain-containing protein n=1 Tax=Caulobacter sp. SL161 TaxID=2995156 RepID=UPI002273C587|nr:WD40 repeat domain-containing protein [Caulobacter sp. SL161]MCY1646373.1 WD40 repeat domain-containing protein [Caulobacter sp. SL161]